MFDQKNNHICRHLKKTNHFINSDVKYGIPCLSSSVWESARLKIWLSPVQIRAEASFFKVECLSAGSFIHTASPPHAMYGIARQRSNNAPTPNDGSFHNQKPEYAEHSIQKAMTRGRMTPGDAALVRMFIAELKGEQRHQQQPCEETHLQPRRVASVHRAVRGEYHHRHLRRNRTAPLKIRVLLHLRLQRSLQSSGIIEESLEISDDRKLMTTGNLAIV